MATVPWQVEMIGDDSMLCTVALVGSDNSDLLAIADRVIHTVDIYNGASGTVALKGMNHVDSVPKSLHQLHAPSTTLDAVDVSASVLISIIETPRFIVATGTSLVSSDSGEGEEGEDTGVKVSVLAVSPKST